MSTDIAEELKRLASSFQKYMNYSLAELIEHILSYNYLPTKAEIARNFGIPPYELSRKIGLLRRLGFVFDINIDSRALGLSRLLIMTKSVLTKENLTKSPEGRFLNFYAPILLPFSGTILMYYIPHGCDSRVFTSMLNDVIIYDVIEDVIYAKARLTVHFDFVSKTYTTKWERLHSIVGDYLKGDRALSTGGDVADKHTRVKYDSLDLLIIKELEKDPFRPLSEVAKTLGVDYAKVLRHYNQHVARIIKGFRLGIIPLPLESSLYILITIRDERPVCRALANALSELVYIGGIYFSSRSMYILVVCDQRFLNDLLRFISTYTGNYEVYLLDRSRRAAFTIPYTEYSKFIRSWSFRWSFRS